MLPKPARKRKHTSVQAVDKLQTTLTEHFLVQHERCPLCSQSFSSIEELIQHAELAHYSRSPVGSSSSVAAFKARNSTGAANVSSPSPPTAVPQACTVQQQQAAKCQEPQQRQAPWWKQADDDPIVAHIRFQKPTSGGQTLQPVRLSVLSAIAPVELVLQALPGALCSRLLTELLAQSSSWVSGSWWFGGQQQTAPRSSATYVLEAQVHDDAGRINSSTSPNADTGSYTTAQQVASGPNQQQLDSPGGTLHTSGTLHHPSHATHVHTLSSAASTQQQQQQQQQQQPSPAPPPGTAAAQPPPEAVAVLGSVPQLLPPPCLQEAVALITDAVNARLITPQQAHWQQQRQHLIHQLLSSSSSMFERPAAAAAAGSQAPAGATHMQGPVGLRAAPQTPAAAPTTAAGTQDAMQQEQQQQQQQQQQNACGGACVPSSGVQWRPSYVLANLYRDGQQSVGSHADRLSSLGPLPCIASVSLGAARVFRLHPANKDVAAAAAAAAAAAVAGAAGARPGSDARLVSSIDITLPHNSLLIMWPPTQEEWKHEVPKTSRVSPHPVSGTQRINLTFRQLAPDWAAAVPRCRCGHAAIMRCALQDGRFVYYYACDNTRGPGCGLYRPAVTLVAGGYS